MQSSNMERSFELLESVADLHLSNNTMDEWLVRLTKITNSAGAYCINWKIGNPKKATRNASDNKYLFPSNWLSSIDDMILQSGLGETGMLDEALQTVDLSGLGTKNPLKDHNLMLGYLKSEPICTLVALRCDDRPEGWTETDRGYFRHFLPVLLKAHLVHKRIVSTENYLNIADKVLNASPRGIITFTPSARIIQANKMAHDLMDGNSSFIEEDGKLLVTEPTIATQLEAKLAEIKTTPINSLKDFVWNRSFLDEKDNRTFQIAMHVNPIDNWHLESGVDDRFIVMFINELGAESKPSSQQLQDFYDLTAAQARLVASLLDGNNIKATAKELKLSIHTVRSHLRSIYKRLGVENNADLLRHISSTLVNYRSE